MEKKLKPENLQELIRRQRLIADYMLTAQALQLQTELFVKEILKREGFGGENYSIDLKTGLITETKKDEPTGDKKNT